LGVAVKVAFTVAHTVGLLTETVGGVFSETVPDADVLEQLVMVLVMITL
jgi:hypothetical protein